MPAVLIVKNDQGKLSGFGEKGERAFARFLAATKRLEVGEMLAFSYKVPRSAKFHRLHFAMLGKVFEAQEQFANDYDMRKWCEVGAGHCRYVPGPYGQIALPLSVDYESLDDAEFAEVHENVKTFLRTLHATRFLWPMLEDVAAGNLVAELLADFDGSRGG